MTDSPNPGEARMINGKKCRFIERELEGDKWEVIDAASPIPTAPSATELDAQIKATLADGDKPIEYLEAQRRLRALGELRGDPEAAVHVRYLDRAIAALKGTAAPSDVAGVVADLRADTPVYNRGPNYEPIMVEPGPLRLKAAALIESLTSEREALKTLLALARPFVADDTEATCDLADRIDAALASLKGGA